jgi:uncharacterized membrane protein
MSWSGKEANTINTPMAYIITLLVSFIWLVLIFAGPFLYKLPENMLFVADFYYYIFHYTCHQIPARCYWLAGFMMPVCVRCFGIYFGAFVALILFPLFRDVRTLKFPRKIWLFLCFGPIGIDGIAQVIHLYPSPHWLRLLTGMLCGGIAMIFILPGFNDVVRIIMREDI